MMTKVTEGATLGIKLIGDRISKIKFVKDQINLGEKEQPFLKLLNRVNNAIKYSI